MALPLPPSKGFASALYQEPIGPWTPVSLSVYGKVKETPVSLPFAVSLKLLSALSHYAQHNAIGQSPETESLVGARGLNSRTFRKYDT